MEEQNININNTNEQNQKRRRKLGWKNYRSFAFLVIIVTTGIVLFSYLVLSFGKSTSTYEVSAGSITLDRDYNLVPIDNPSTIEKGFNGNYVLSTTSKEGGVKYNLGKNAVVFSDSDYKLYLYGQAYLINNDTSIKKLENYEEISKSKPSFYKLDDRKYLLADKTISAKEASLDTNGFLIVELDKQGNATLVNHKTNMKTINPIIIKGTYYDFDVAHEKLIIDGEEIDLTNVIGSTNEHEDPAVPNTQEEDEPTETTGISEDASILKNYYDKYFDRIRNSFNNLYSSANKTNASIDSVARKTNVALDLTRWTNITGVSATPTSLTVNYQVFDPNNEYSQIFMIIGEQDTGKETRYYVSKEYTSYMIRDLLPNHKYTIKYGYALAKVVDEAQSDIYVDNLVVVTPKPKTEIRISKITTSRLYYVLKLDREFEYSRARIHLIIDGTERASVDYDPTLVADFTYEGSFAYDKLGSIVEITVTDMEYNGMAVEGTITNKFINE